MTLHQLLNTPGIDRAHVKKRKFEAYVRLVPRILGGTEYRTLTIADFQMADLTEESLQAAFEDWFQGAEKLSAERGMSIAFENAGGWPWMERFLARNHFVRDLDQRVNRTQLDAYRIYRETL